MEPKTEREILIQVSGKVDNLTEGVIRLANALESLESGKIEDHGKRISAMENTLSKYKGGFITLGILLTVLNLLIAWMAYIKH